MESVKNDGFYFLPSEIVEQILCDNRLDCKDVCNFSTVCSYFHELANSNKVWKVKLKQSYPDLCDIYQASGVYDWRSECRHQVELVGAVQMVLEQMAVDSYNKDSLSDEAYSDLLKLLDRHPRALWFIINGLRLILTDKWESNLTQKYYAQTALSFVVHHHLTDEWTRYLQLPPDQQLLENGAVMLSQWFQCTSPITVRQTGRQLDKLACLVQTELRNKCPQHVSSSPAGSGSAALTSDVRLLLRTMHPILWTRVADIDGIHICSYLQKRTPMRESRDAIPYSLALAYVLVAQRLGVTLDVVDLSNNSQKACLLRWREHSQLPDEAAQYTFYDLVEGGRFLTVAQCIANYHLSQKLLLQTLSPIQLLRRLVDAVLHCSEEQHDMEHFIVECLRLSFLLEPDNYQHALLFAQLQLHMDINHRQTLDVLTRLTEQEHFDPHELGRLSTLINLTRTQMERHQQPRELDVKRRQDQEAEFGALKFSVGMVMKHRRYNYLCVIRGWDHRCTAGKRWRQQMGIDMLPRQERQPFYNVLVEDSSSRYAAEDNLTPAPNPMEIGHPEVGKYFQSFCGIHYQLNSASQKRYPDDQEFTELEARANYDTT